MSFPFFGEEFTFTQPDGTRLRVRGWGDQHRAVFETLDGFTLVRDPVTRFYQYAAVTPDGEELRATGVRPGAINPRTLGLPASVRVSREAARARAELGAGLPRPRWQSRRAQTKARLRVRAEANILPAPPFRPTLGNRVGLCLPIEFPDVPQAITRGQVEAFCNESGHAGFGNQGSVHDYFLDNSAGQLRYTTVVTPYYTALQPRDYYTNPAVDFGTQARELIREALAHHVRLGFDFTSLTVDDQDYVYATNVFYAGPVVNAWKEGLWPHASRLLTPFELAPGRRAFDYQITNIGDALTLGTYCHENGHMLCAFPDLYDLGQDSAGIGVYCLMAAGGNADKRNPTQVCAYLKHQAGWGSTTPITRGLTATVTAGRNEFFIHEKNQVEYFIIENRVRVGRDQALSDSGLAIWHVDELGDNSNQQMTFDSHYECSLIQADGNFDLENGVIPGDEKDLFHAGWRDHFSDATVPSSRWWDGTPSGLEVSNIGPAEVQMTFSANV